jgi:hypothetical protein
MLFHPFSRKGHLVAKPNHFIDYDFFYFGLILRFHVIDDFGMMCKNACHLNLIILFD